MTQAANITVKNGAGLDKTFTLISPAAGDGGLAQWALKEGLISSVFPVLTTSTTARPNGRRLKVKFFIPSSYTDSVTGLTLVNNRAEANLDVAVPADFPEAHKDDFVALLTNLLSSPVIKSQIRDAVPAT